MSNLLRNILDGETYSELEVNGLFDIKTFLGKKNIGLQKSYGIFDGEIKYKECIFKTSANIFIKLTKKDNTDFFEVVIYYKEDQKNEVLIFLNQIKKI